MPSQLPENPFIEKCLTTDTLLQNHLTGIPGEAAGCCNLQEPDAGEAVCLLEELSLGDLHAVKEPGEPAH